jgi:hypothetical protein
MHLCDISSRERFLSPQAFAIDNRLTLLKQDDYYKCLTDGSNQYKDQSDFYFTPTQILVGQRCAVKYDYIKEEEPYCGKLIFSETKKREIADKLNITNSAYQNKLRSIALDMREIQCKEDPDGAFETMNTVNCMVQDLDGNFKDDGEDNLLRITTGFSDSNQRSDFVSKITEEGKTYFRSNFESQIKDVFKSIIIESQADKYETDLDDSLNFIQAGWFTTGLVFFVNGDATEDMTSELDLLTTTYYSTFDLKIADSNTEEEEFRKAQKLSITTLDGMFRVSDKGIDNFQLIDIGKLISGETYANGNCQEDLSKCTVVSANPFYTLIHHGQKMVKDATMASSVLNLGKMLIEYFTSNSELSSFLDFPIFALNTYLVVGFVLSIIIPLIPFLISVGKIFGWLIDLCVAMVAIPILGAYYVIPDDSNEFVGSEKVIYQLFLKMFLLPMFLVISMCAAFIFTGFGIGVLHLLLSIMLSGLGLVMDITSIMGIVNGLVGVSIYTILLCSVVVASSLSIHFLPAELNRYLGLDIKNKEVFSKMKNVLENNVATAVKPMIPKI